MSQDQTCKTIKRKALEERYTGFWQSGFDYVVIITKIKQQYLLKFIRELTCQFFTGIVSFVRKIILIKI